MFAVVLALLSAVGFGMSDFTAGIATRATSVIRVVLLDQVAAIILVLLVVPWTGGHGLSPGAALWGAASGVSGIAGGMVLYLGFRNAEFSVASTLSAVGSAALSVLAGLLLGERPNTLAFTGIALALPAIAAVSASPAEAKPPGPEAHADPAEASASPAEASAGPAEASAGPASATRRVALGRHAVGVGYGLLAGVCFAMYFVSLNRAGSGSGLWPIMVCQLASLTVIICIALVARELRFPPAGARLNSVLTGLLGTAATIMFFFASHRGLLAVTAVITSLYPGGTILLARVMLGERLTRVRLGGLCLAAASVALIAAAGSG
jgi:drug/metabolite transporter (DMT)-like permease